MTISTLSTREKIISAAAALFYGEGIRSTSVDAISAKAGITKRTLYYHFNSKDELVEAYLLSRDQPTLDLYKRWFEKTPGSVDKKIEGIFREFGLAAQSPKWKGCGFLRTSAELAGTPGHPAIQAGAAHKKKFEAWLRDILADGGIDAPDDAARKILVLLDGAASVMLVHRDATYVDAAGAVAATLASKAR